MLVKDFLSLYQHDTFVKLLSEKIKLQSSEDKHLQIKGLLGSLDAVIASAIFLENPLTNVFVLNDREDAAYFLNDLQNLLGDDKVLFFPMSYKKSYVYEEIDNANVLMRAEVLNRLNGNADQGLMVVTYPEALSEKVINKRSLIKNTFTISVGDKLDTDFLLEFLINQDFERNDFVFEAGHFAIRGGIVDIFSFANELPFRIELWGNEVESIRTFDPETQLSKESLSKINVIPNVQTKLVQESRESFFHFLPFHTFALIP